MMASVQVFLNFVKDYQERSNLLSKCSVFVKRHSKTKQGDFYSFCNIVGSERVLQKELDDLIEESKTKSWEIIINSYHIDKNRISLKLFRTSFMKSIFVEISGRQRSYGSSNLLHNKTYKILCDECKGLTQLRMTTAAKVISALVILGGGSVTTADTDDIVHLSKAHNKNQSIYVSPVNVSATMDVSEKDFIQLRTEDILAISDHKDLSEQSVQQLVDAAIVFDLLSVKLEKPLLLDVTAQAKPTRKSNCKGAPFVLYNYARLCAILERFDYYVTKGLYQPLPSVHDINYNLLSDEDEWSLVFDLLAQWPCVVAGCQDLRQPRLHQITGFLSSLASTFSVYYRHARVLNEGLTHLLPLMEARIYLLLAIKQVFLIAFSLLGIVAPTTM